MTYLYEALDKPTRLYIKKCPHCSLKYFGKTVNEDIEKYPGSGVRWRNHLKKHKVKAMHLWNSDWYYDTSIVKFATKFSVINKIVENSQWANLNIENGLDGGPVGKYNGMFGKKHSEDSRKLMSEKISGENHPFYGIKRPIHSEKMSGENHHKFWLGKKNPEHSKRLRGKKFSKEHVDKLKAVNSGVNNPMFGVKRPKSPCKYCEKMVDAANMARYHGEKCKIKEYDK